MALEETTAASNSPDEEQGASLAQGSVLLGRYTVQSLTGRGSLGCVFKATDQTDGKEVALRQLPADLTADEDLCAALEEQLQAASALSHKNIVQQQKVFQEGGRLYVAMEFIQGQTLRELIAKKKNTGNPFSLKGSYNVVAHLCNALEVAHQQEVPLIHGLPGPGAVMVNNSGRIKLTDFGLLGAMMERTTKGAPMTDSDCLAPELRDWSGAVGPAADIYALGSVLHMLLTGEAPSGPGARPSAISPDLSQEVDRVVARCLDQDPSARYQQTAEVKAAFYEAIGAAATPSRTALSDEDVQPLNHTPPPIPKAVLQAPIVSTPRPPSGQMAAPIPPPQMAPPSGPMPAPIMPLGQAHQQSSTLEDMLAVDGEDEAERWLVQKDRLDFGPFSMTELKRQLHQGQFGGDDTVKDQETGKSSRIRNLPQLREFIVKLEQAQAAKEVEKTEMKKWESEKRRRTVTVTMVAVSLLVLGIGGAVAAYFLTREPEIREKIIYQDRTDEALKKLIASMEITFKTQAPDSPNKKKRRRKRPRKTGDPAAKAGTPGYNAEGQEVTYLGDVNEEGGDARLSEAVVQRVMQQNFRKLVPCVYGELKRGAKVNRVDIDFGIRGTGRVLNAKVNGKLSGPFHACIVDKMKQIKFPEFAGSLTPASFYMTLK